MKTLKKPKTMGRRRPTRLFAAILALSSALALGAAPAPAAAECCGSDHGVGEEYNLPDQVRVQFRSGGDPTFYPRRLILLGPQRALVAALPKRAEPVSESRLPLGRIRPLGAIVDERPLIDRLGRGTALGRLYRRGDALVAVFDGEGAYRDALWRLRNKVGLVTRLSRSRALVSLRLGLAFSPIGRREALAGGLEGPIGVVHGADAVLALTPPRGDLPAADLF